MDDSKATKDHAKTCKKGCEEIQERQEPKTKKMWKKTKANNGRRKEISYQNTLDVDDSPIITSIELDDYTENVLIP